MDARLRGATCRRAQAFPKAARSLRGRARVCASSRRRSRGGNVSHPFRRQVRAVEHNGRRSGWIRGGKESGHRGTLRIAEQGCAFRTCRIHDCAYIVHARLEIRDTAHAVRNSGPALVEDDQSAKGPKTAVEAREARLLPAVVDVGHEARHEDQVEGPVADDLVGDVDVAALGVARLRSLHVHSVQQRIRPSKRGKNRLARDAPHRGSEQHSGPSRPRATRPAEIRNGRGTGPTSRQTRPNRQGHLNANDPRR
jgi:hypothetical protein